MKDIAVVTGASSGLGRKLAIQIAEKFAVDEIWLIARRKSRMLDVAKKINEDYRVNVVVIPTDLTNNEYVDRIYERLRKYNPNIKILVNASGYGIVGESDIIDRKAQEKMIVLNCVSLFSLTNMCVKYMSEGSGIIQISSAAAFCPQPYFAVYGATKSFVLDYSLALAEELKSKKIQVSVVCPGPIDTEFFDVATSFENSITNIMKKNVMQGEDEVVDKIINGYIKGKKIIPSNMLMSVIAVTVGGIYSRMLGAKIVSKMYKR